MARRKTIGKDPLAETAAAIFSAGYSAEIVPIPIPDVVQNKAAGTAPPPESVRPFIKIKSAPPRPMTAKERYAVGGCLEILGGDLGAGDRTIWPTGPNGRLGFAAPNGRIVDLAGDLALVHAWRDRTEHRFLSALGWAWVMASVGGIPGLVAGGGLRLLEPRRMMIALQLKDGSRLVARSDSITIAGLKAFVS